MRDENYYKIANVFGIAEKTAHHLRYGKSSQFSEQYYRDVILAACRCAAALEVWERKVARNDEQEDKKCAKPA